MIPAPTDRGIFGEHDAFHLGACPRIARGHPRFRHAGHWILLIDPWSESWAEDGWPGTTTSSSGIGMATTS